MKYYTAEEVERILNNNHKYRDKLYCRGFLLSTDDSLSIDKYPFYGNWTKDKYDICGLPLTFYVYKGVKHFVYTDGSTSVFLIGHAYNPFTMQYDESEILESLAAYLDEGSDLFWKKESELTGVFCIGYVKDEKVCFSTDCTGMQLTYYSEHDGNIYITSHSKLVADYCGYERTEYISKLIDNRFWHYFGTWLPGDLSPYAEITRTVPNHEVSYDMRSSSFNVKRYFPFEKIEEVSMEDYNHLLNEIADIETKTMYLISQKWPEKKAAISVTGGCDSNNTLACANGLYDKFKYFSYISNEAEKVDAEAAAEIAKHLGNEHTIYAIPEESSIYDDIEIFKMILECNAGCIGHNNLNDVKKRMYFSQIDDFDAEVKSWVNEMCRAELYHTYSMKKFKKKAGPKDYRVMWKLLINYRLIKESNKVMEEFLKKYYASVEYERMHWTDYFLWEFNWAAGESIFLTAEHKTTYDITIPYNNRLLVEMMLRLPFEKRLKDEVPEDIINKLNPSVSAFQERVNNLEHTGKRALMRKIYIKTFSHF